MTRKSPATSKANQNKRVKIYVTAEDIANAECRKPEKCMIKVAVKRALNLAHGYVFVDSTGISISRNGKYREKSFLPTKARDAMVIFDKEKPLKPFSFWVEFIRTRNINKVTPRQRKEYTERAKRTGNAKKKYTMRERVVGLTLSTASAA